MFATKPKPAGALLQVKGLRLFKEDRYRDRFTLISVHANTERKACDALLSPLHRVRLETNMGSQPFDYSRLSSYFRELADTSKPDVASSPFPAELRRACGPWVSVTAAVAKASLALAGVKTAGSAVDLVAALSDAGDAQTELLKSIKADTLLLRQEPLQTAITLMSEAHRVRPGNDRWAAFLKDAVASLYRAKSLAASSGEQAVVYFGLACAYLTLDETMDARYWVGESIRAERETIDAFLQQQMFITDVRSETWSPNPKAPIELSETPPLINWKIGMATGKTQRTQKFRQFLPFANSVEISAATISGRPAVEILDTYPETSLFQYHRVGVWESKWIWKDNNYRLYKKIAALPARKLLAACASAGIERLGKMM